MMFLIAESSFCTAIKSLPGMVLMALKRACWITFCALAMRMGFTLALSIVVANKKWLGMITKFVSIFGGSAWGTTLSSYLPHFSRIDASV